MRLNRTVKVPALAIVALAAVAVCCAGGAAWALKKSSPPAPTYDSLARTEHVRHAPGRALGLSRVVIAPGARIPLHHHLGTQVSFIQRGTLTYTVRDGGVRVMRGPGDSGHLVRRIKAGQTGKIRAGNWIVEQPSTIHRAANRGKSKVVIYLANLFGRNAPPSAPVK